MPVTCGADVRVCVAAEVHALVKEERKLGSGLGNDKGRVSPLCFRPLGCQRKVYNYEKTSVPGQFTYFSTRESPLF